MQIHTRAKTIRPMQGMQIAPCTKSVPGARFSGLKTMTTHRLQSINLITVTCSVIVADGHTESNTPDLF